jgi:hypothetical protein
LDGEEMEKISMGGSLEGEGEFVKDDRVSKLQKKIRNIFSEFVAKIRCSFWR